MKSETKLISVDVGLPRRCHEQWWSRIGRNASIQIR